MKTERFDEFKKFVDGVILPATDDIEKLGDVHRKHVQKLVYTNLVDRFDAMIDGVILDNCRNEHLVEEAMKGLTQQINEADLIRFLMHGDTVQNVIDNRLKGILQNAVLRQRHSKKLAILFKVLSPKEECWNKPRVNIPDGQIFEKVTPQNNTTPYSICGYADWLYSRRNSIVHGAGTSKFLENDLKQINTLFNCKSAKTFKIKLSSVKNAAKFYQDVVVLLLAK